MFILISDLDNFRKVIR